MKKIRPELLVCVIFIILFIYTGEGHAQNQKLNFLADSFKKVRIIINQSYENCRPEEINLPIDDISVRLFNYAGVDVVSPDALDYDGTIKIKIEGKAEGTYYYPAGYLYTGAYLAGKISLESKNITIFEKKFEVYINTPSLTSVTWNPLRPCDAPFARAFYLSGSVISKLLEIIYDVYGINALISALKETNTDIQNMVIEALVNIGKPAAEPLIAALYADDLNVKKGSIDALGKLGDNQAVEDIILALNEEDSGIRWRAARALGNFQDKRAVEPLIAKLTDENKIVRWYAAKSLGDIRDLRAIDPLTAILKDEDPGVQYYAKESLKKINGINLNKITEIEIRERYQ
ncbi:MAG: HEAT repeat domain-containing protein [bacterium]